jgi:hypothetical protein
MKCNFFITAFVGLFTVIAFNSCIKGDNNNNSGSADNIVAVRVKNGDDLNRVIDVVKALIGNDREDGGGNRHVVASAPYKDGGFTLKLSASIDDQYLGKFADNMPKNIQLSDSDAKGGSVHLYAYKSEIGAGEFYHGTADWKGYLMYADRDVSMTGAAGTKEYDLHLKRGWNMVYEKNEEITTAVPSDVQWHFDDDSVSDWEEEEEEEEEEEDDGSGNNSVIVNNTLSVKVENGNILNGRIDLVKAEVRVDSENGSWDVYILASAPYSNGGFTLELPANPDARYLESLKDLLEDLLEDMPAGITLSDANAKMMEVELNAYRSGKEAGWFYHGTAGGFGIADRWGGLMYADRDVSITGSGNNLHLKRGWNIIYAKKTEGMTTTVPTSAKWYFEE